jgi:hypothetical protein
MPSTTLDQSLFDSIPEAIEAFRKYPPAACYFAELADGGLERKKRDKKKRKLPY